MNRGLNPGLGLAILRIVLGVIFVAHGWPKLFGGLEQTAGFMTTLGIPAPVLSAWAVALLETGGGLSLLVGYLVSPVSLLLAIHMFIGIFLVHGSNGFYVVGEGTGGYEFNLVLIAALLVLVFVGHGHWALQDRRRQDIIRA